MGAHVSIVPNHQTGRSTSLDARYQVARLFNLGYELDLTKCSEEERKEIADQIQEYKEQRGWLQNGLVILKFRMKIILHGRLFLRREKNAKLLSCRNCLIRDILMEEFISVVCIRNGITKMKVPGRFSVEMN